MAKKETTNNKSLEEIPKKLKVIGKFQKGQDDYKNGKYVSVDELEKEAENW